MSDNIAKLVTPLPGDLYNREEVAGRLEEVAASVRAGEVVGIGMVWEGKDRQVTTYTDFADRLRWLGTLTALSISTWGS